MKIRFGRFFGGVLFALGLGLSPTFAQQPQAPATPSLEHCTSDSADGQLQHVRIKTVVDALCNKGDIVQVTDNALGIHCVRSGSKLDCTAAEPTEVEHGPDVKFCAKVNTDLQGAKLPTEEELRNMKVGEIWDRIKNFGKEFSKMQATGFSWSTKSECTGVVPAGIPHRMVKLNLTEQAVCLMPGDGCVDLAELSNEGLEALLRMGFGGAIEEVVIGMTGKRQKS